MTATVTKVGPYYSSGPISFSSLRLNFKETSSGSIKVSELRRNTTVTDKNPIVPDATENSNISTTSNLKLSQFRNSIKYYYISQTNTNINFNINAQSWNNNLNKNIKKWMYIYGTCGSNSTSSAAVSFNDTAYNLTIDIFGYIYGAGGSGGTASTISGGSGGHALSVVSPGGNNIIINLRGGAQVYGGGGGGEKGANGATGYPGTCYTSRQVTERYTTGNRCRSCPDCDPGWYRIDCYQREGRCDWRGQFRKSLCERVYTVYDPYSVPGAPGGGGGNGSAGRGYNNLTASLFGIGGTLGVSGGCPSYGGTGNTGETGGNGGDWGTNGGNTTNIGNGGLAGRAITGSNYTVSGQINSLTVRGLYAPQ